MEQTTVITVLRLKSLDFNFVFGLPEAYWPGIKGPNEVISMLHHVLMMHKQDSRTKDSKHLIISADNCSGQNKNRWMAWYCSWLVSIGLFESVRLKFLVAGHTKNICDGTVGHIKRRFSTSEILNPSEMMACIYKSARNTKCVSAVSVKWINWKNLFKETYKKPASFLISRYHDFFFKKSHPGSVFAREYSFSSSSDEFNLLKNKAEIGNNVAEIENKIENDSELVTWASLSDTNSAKEGNRKAYLTKFIAEKYFPNDETFVANYFASGDSWTDNSNC